MQTSLAVTALLMGLAGGPHCIAMCGAACAGIGKAAGDHGARAIWLFQAGRLAGYATLGALAAASMQGLGWLTVQTAAIRPVWTLFHVAAVVLGLRCCSSRASRSGWTPARVASGPRSVR